MRIRKRRQKRIDMHDTSVLSSDTAFAQSAKALFKAQEIAEYNMDIDAIVAISDRWNMLARALDAGTEQEKMPLGFVREQEGENEHNS